MILKELRISRHLTQEQLAQMSGLNVRTIQRIESGSNASLESLKCLAAVLEVDVSTLNQEKLMIDKKEADGRTIEGIRIYDHSDPDKSIIDMIYAAKGEMYTTADQKFLIMQLFDGYAIKEVRGESAKQDIKSFNRRGRPVNRIYFKKLRKTFSLSELLNLTVTDISSKQYDMMNSFELFHLAGKYCHYKCFHLHLHLHV